MNGDIPYGRRSRRRGRFIAPTADLSAYANPTTISIILFITIIGQFSSITRKHREPDIDSTEREQKATHRTNGQRNPQKETGLKNRSLHEGVGKVMTSKLSTWQAEH